jgi:predicted phosphoribosyltransferase
LGHQFSDLIEKKPLVLGIPRGGLVTAQAVASVLECDIDIMLTHKIGAPANPEFAIGAVSEEGRLFLNEEYVETTGAGSVYLEEEKTRQFKELNRRRKLFRSIYPKIPLNDRIVIITDDGIATGATAQAALWAAREEKPKILIGAFPVAPLATVKRLSNDADEILCLRVPATFYAISQFYYNFEQVSDEEVLAILKKARRNRGGQHAFRT